MWINISLIVSSVLLSSGAQILIKKGISAFGQIEFSAHQILQIIVGIVSNLYLFSAMALYGISLLLWFVTLSRVNLSVAYPFQSLGYVFTLVAGYLFFNEPFSLLKVLGIVMIYGGVVLLALSGELT